MVTRSVGYYWPMFSVILDVYKLGDGGGKREGGVVDMTFQCIAIRRLAKETTKKGDSFVSSSSGYANIGSRENGGAHLFGRLWANDDIGHTVALVIRELGGTVVLESVPIIAPPPNPDQSHRPTMSINHVAARRRTRRSAIVRQPAMCSLQWRTEKYSRMVSDAIHSSCLSQSR